MTDVKQELPNLRDQIPREWLLVSAMMGARSATLADILRLLPLLEPEQQEACRQKLITGGVVKMVRALEEERDAAIKRAEEAEASLAHMVKCAHACDEVDAENEKLREQLAGMTDAHASAQEVMHARALKCGRLELENEKLRGELTQAQGKYAVVHTQREKAWDDLAEANRRESAALQSARELGATLRDYVNAIDAFFPGPIETPEQRIENMRRFVVERDTIAEKTARERAVVEISREATSLYDPVFGVDAVNGSDFAEWLTERLLPALEALDSPLVTDAPSKPYREHARILGQLGMYAIRTDKSGEAIAREIASWPEEAPQGGKELGQLCRHCRRGLFYHTWPSKFFGDGTVNHFDPAPPPPPDSVDAKFAAIEAEYRAPSPHSEPAETRCKHGAPNCGGHHDD